MLYTYFRYHSIRRRRQASKDSQRSRKQKDGQWWRGHAARGRWSTLLIREAPFFDHMIVKGHRPTLALLVDIEQVFFHCPKAFMRSELWHPETWNPTVLPSTACIVKRS